MGRRRFPIAIVALSFASGCSFQASCGNAKGIDGKKLEKGIAGFVETNVKVAPDKVSCPSKIELENGGEFSCEVTVEGQVLRVDVVQTDGEGAVTYGFAPNVVSLDKVAAAAAARIKQVKNVDAVVDCGGRIRGTKAGETFTCTATAANGDKAAIEIKIVDDQGHFDYGDLTPI